mgnify:CR=1 FL=1
MPFIQFNSDAAAFVSDAGHGRRSATEKRVEHEVAFVGGGEQTAFDERDRLLCRVLAEGFFFVARRGHRPDGVKVRVIPGKLAFAPDRFHLFAGNLSHLVVVEDVLGFFVFRCPENRFRGVRKVAATQVWRRIRFFPSDIVEDLEAQLLHGITDGENDVVRAADPDSAVGLENALAAVKPFAVEVVVFVRALRFVPIALVHLDHFSGVTSDAAIGKEVRRISKNAVEPALGIFGGYGIQQLKTVAMIKPEAAGRIREAQFGGAFYVAGLCDDCAVLAKLKVGGSNRRGWSEIVLMADVWFSLGWFDAIKRLRFAWRFCFRHAGSIDQIRGSDQLEKQGETGASSRSGEDSFAHWVLRGSGSGFWAGIEDLRFEI